MQNIKSEMDGHLWKWTLWEVDLDRPHKAMDHGPRNHPFESLSDDVLLDIQEKITADIKNQLQKSPSDRTRMLPTFVDKLPTGTESGDFLVLDFGGHFFRVAYVNIKKSEKILNSEQQRRIDQRRLTIRNRSIIISWVIWYESYETSHLE